MAFVAGDQVLPVNSNPSFTPRAVAQPPTFGVITAIAATNVGILWDNGTFDATVPLAVLDRVTTPNAAEALRLNGQVVRVQSGGADTISDSPSYDSEVVTLYRRDFSGAGAPSSDTFALILTLEGGVYREVVSTTLQVVPR